jgi:rare lipoprotein A
MKKGVIILLLIVFNTSCIAAEEGYASYYAGKFQGRLTANGEIFDTKRFTAAHKSLPFNTIVRVTNPESGKSTLVRINDRGPFVEERIIDLSRIAAAAIGIVAQGVAWVSVDIVIDGDGATYHRTGYSTEFFAVQVGAFGDIENAKRLQEILAQAGLKAILEPANETVTRVVIRGVPREDILLTKNKLQVLGHYQVLIRKE